MCNVAFIWNYCIWLVGVCLSVWMVHYMWGYFEQDSAICDVYHCLWFGAIVCVALSKDVHLFVLWWGKGDRTIGKTKLHCGGAQWQEVTLCHYFYSSSNDPVKYEVMNNKERNNLLKTPFFYLFKCAYIWTYLLHYKKSVFDWIFSINRFRYVTLRYNHLQGEKDEKKIEFN